MRNYSQILRISWRVIMSGCLAALIVGCGETDRREVAGIDGSGKVPIPEPGGDIGLGEPSPLIVQGSINGFGSVIIHGDHYDTENAVFYRHGHVVTEADFEVGDMIAMSGYSEDSGKLFAEQVFFEPTVRGRVEAYDDIAGVATVLGQRVRIDAETVIGKALDDKALYGQEVTISGWLQDGEVLATRITQAKTAESSKVRGYVNQVDGVQMRAQIGMLNIDYSSLSEPLTIEEGDVVLFEGTLNTGDDYDYLVASKALNFATTLAQNEKVVESATIAGAVRNIENTRFWINGVEVIYDANTVVDDGSIDKIASGDRLVVKGKPMAAAQLLAEKIVFKSNRPKSTLTGVITSLQVDGEPSIDVDGQRITIKPDTAIVDLLQSDSRLSLSTLNIGDYLVVTAIKSDNGFIASSIKRTQKGLNDRKFDGSDDLSYDWGFEVESRSATDQNENLLFAGKLLSVDLDLNRVTLSNSLLQLRVSSNNNTEVYDNEGKFIQSGSAAAELNRLLIEKDNRTIWVHLQGDRRSDIIYADRLVIKLDWYGREITGEQAPE